jgi:exopolyphosphatase / guanosine-5'-triphosphate,3'-diphosphate pyrophosphatase
MRLAVLDVGSNSAHLRVVDAAAGWPPLPVLRFKAPTRLAEAVSPDGELREDGVERLVRAVAKAVRIARRHTVTELIPLATATIRDAANADFIRERVRQVAGVDLTSLSGEDEARLTFLAVRRWLGWSAGPLLLLDIGGASMEIAWGSGEHPDLAISLPLGAGRLTRQLMPRHPAGDREIKAVGRRVREMLGPLTERLMWDSVPVCAVGTSKTFKQLARLLGAPPWRRGPALRRRINRGDLDRWVPRLAAMSAEERAALPGVSVPRSRQLLAGAVTAATVMRTLDVDHVDVCPWALREGILLRRIDELTHPRQRHQADVISIAVAGTGERAKRGRSADGRSTGDRSADGRSRAGRSTAAKTGVPMPVTLAGTRPRERDAAPSAGPDR